eukprot:ANDGO_01966.mRNA.1 putative sulfoacetate transporter SauU
MSKSSSGERLPLIQGSLNSDSTPTDLADLPTSGCFHPKKQIYKYTFLSLACLLTFGSYFCYDNPAALMTYIQDDLDVNSLEFQTLYAVYSFPNTVLTIFGGFIMDKYLGIKLGAIIFAVLIFLGQCVFALGATIRTFWVMVLGRFIFGLGGETLGVAQNTYVAKVFIGDRMALAFGIALSVSRVGSAVNMAVEPLIAEKYNLAIALWVGAAICFLSTIISICAAFLFKWGEKRNKSMRIKPEEQDNLSLKDVRYFPLEFWLLSLVCVCFYSAVFPFISLAMGFLTDRYGYSASDAGFICGLPYTVSAAASPFFGFTVDRFGKNPYFCLLACLSLAGIYFAFFSASVSAIALFVCLGVVYSLLAASLWPVVTKCIKPEHQSTAYGVMTAFQNTGLCIFALSSGALADSLGFDAVLILFIGLLGLASLLCVWLIIIDIRKGGHLSRSAGELAAIVAKAEKAKEDAEAAAEADHENLFVPAKPTALTAPTPSQHPTLVRRSQNELRAAYLQRIGIRH